MSLTRAGDYVQQADHVHAAGSGPWPLLIILIATLAGGWIVLRGGRLQMVLPALVAGFLLATAVRQASELTAAGPTIVPLVIVAMATYGLFVQIHALGHRHDRVIGTSGATIFLAHRYVEGLAIGAATTLSPQLAVATLAAVGGHSAAEGGVLVSYLSVVGTPIRWTYGWLLAAALVPVLGAGATNWITIPSYATEILTAGLIGLFLFAARVTLTTALREAGALKTAALACVGAGLSLLLILAG